MMENEKKRGIFNWIRTHKVSDDGDFNSLYSDTGMLSKMVRILPDSVMVFDLEHRLGRKTIVNDFENDNIHFVITSTVDETVFMVVPARGSINPRGKEHISFIHTANDEKLRRQPGETSNNYIFSVLFTRDNAKVGEYEKRDIIGIVECSEQDGASNTLEKIDEESVGSLEMDSPVQEKRNWKLKRSNAVKFLINKSDKNHEESLKIDRQSLLNGNEEDEQAEKYENDSDKTPDNSDALSESSSLYYSEDIYENPDTLKDGTNNGEKVSVFPALDLNGDPTYEQVLVRNINQYNIQLPNNYKSNLNDKIEKDTPDEYESQTLTKKEFVKNKIQLFLQKAIENSVDSDSKHKELGTDKLFSTESDNNDNDNVETIYVAFNNTSEEKPSKDKLSDQVILNLSIGDNSQKDDVKGDVVSATEPKFNSIDGTNESRRANMILRSREVSPTSEREVEDAISLIDEVLVTPQESTDSLCTIAAEYASVDPEKRKPTENENPNRAHAAKNSISDTVDEANDDENCNKSTEDEEFSKYVKLMDNISGKLEGGTVRRLKTYQLRLLSQVEELKSRNIQLNAAKNSLDEQLQF